MERKFLARCGRGSPQRVYILDDGSEWTILKLQNYLNKRWKRKDISLHLVRSRLQKHTNPDKVFAKPIVTKPRTILTKSDKDISREMMNLALKNI